MKCENCRFILHSTGIGIGFCANGESENYMERIFKDDEACDQYKDR